MSEPAPGRRRSDRGRGPRDGGVRRTRAPRGASRVGERFTAEVGPVAHGGHCVARVQLPGQERPRVVFVRHALPGERVVLEVTEGSDGDRFWRADAVVVEEASPHRVDAPCPFAGPGLCGGCDFQHVDLAHQRRLKADVVAEQLRRLAGLDLDVEVEAVPGDLPEQLAGLRWRTRVRYVALPDGGRGMRRHRAHDVVEVDDCRIAHPDAREPRPGVVHEEVAAGGTGHRFAVEAAGFWQVHPGAPATLVEAVLGMLAPGAGERALDLYGGVGLFARFLADRVGPDGSVVSVEGDAAASAHAATNLADAPGAPQVRRGDVAQVLRDGLGDPVDVVVLDPPREGAGREVVDEVVRRSPRAVAYVACDPAALARDVASFAERGYRLERLRGFDLFPMTHHVECVALLVPDGRDAA
ncbi:TRAM domain-containing protein [Nocardioides sp. ChNu-99]|uniref:class I SAM-dependent RNA methyltransferase n=1 Tax=Nocardioides sp. ChNu-99 TaxID=2839897 RepID=UPI002406A7ED|nr:TRAM domain-containing protein [Nocardioides sp. ChNu-99]MDF9715364.1 class I SAM-dependent RNA methyltransferase [Nocardioides sp. ChNu-99]